MQLSVIIVNYNVKYFLEQCLFSVRKAIRGMHAEILVVDNASADGSRAYLEPRFPDVQFFWNDNNPGFAKANNQALQKARGEYILFLNPDTIVPEDCFERSIEFLQHHQDAGALGIRMMDGTGQFLPESKRSFPSPLTSFFKMTGLASLFPGSPVFARYYMGHLDPLKNHETDVLAGAFMLVRKSVLDITGGFDESFFMYGEDIDLSYRIQKAGFKNYYFAETPIIHFKGESTKKGSLNYVRVFYKAMNIFVTKHYGGAKAGLFHFFINTAIVLRAILAAISNMIKKAGLPLTDALLILLAFWLAKLSRERIFRPDPDYSGHLLTVAFPVFTLLFLLSAYYTGLYDKPQKRGLLIFSTAFAALVILLFYPLFPERYRFSLTILLTGSAFAFILLNISRYVFRRWNLIDFPEKEELMQTVIAGTEEEYNRVKYIQQWSGKGEQAPGRIELIPDRDQNRGLPGRIKELSEKLPFREIIFCENGLSFKEIIQLSTGLKKGVRIRISAKGSESVVGSDSRYSSGTVISLQSVYRIGLPVNRRLKRLTDIVSALLVLISFPVQLLLAKNKTGIIRNCLQVLLAQKTWIGYNTRNIQLPSLRTCILGNNGLPPEHLLSEENEELFTQDLQYAKNYSPYKDLVLLWKSYRNLGA